MTAKFNEGPMPIGDVKPRFITRAEHGASAAGIKATETIRDLLAGMDTKNAISTLMNATAMLLMESCRFNETRAKEEARQFGKEVQRCIEVNSKLCREKCE